MIKKVLAIGALVVGSLFVLPVAAQAADSYTPISDGEKVVASAGGTTFGLSGFLAGESVDISYDDNGGTFQLAATQTITKTADGTGTVTVTATGDPGDSSVITAVGQTSGTEVTATITIAAASAGTTADTGVNPGPAIWLAGGLVAVGAALVLTFVAVRRQNAKVAA